MRYNALSPIMEKAVTEGGVHSFRGGGDHYSRVFGCRWDRRIRQAIAELQAASTGPAHWSARLKLFADNARHGARSLALSSLRITLLPSSNCGVERLWLMSASRQGDGVGIKHQLGAIVRLQFRVWHYAGANRKALRHSCREPSPYRPHKQDTESTYRASRPNRRQHRSAMSCGSLARFAAVQRLSYSVHEFLVSEGFSEQLDALSSANTILS